MKFEVKWPFMRCLVYTTVAAFIVVHGQPPSPPSGRHNCSTTIGQLVNVVANLEAQLRSERSRECTASPADDRKGTSYIRWGRKSCRDNATLVYQGYAAGPRYTEGGSGSNFLCLPEDPEWKTYRNGHQQWTGSVAGIEYELYEAKTRCPDGWATEYSGYLVSAASRNGWHRSSYVCMDEAPEVALGSTSQSQGLMYPVEVECGTLPCSVYTAGRELTCVVCSK